MRVKLTGSLEVQTEVETDIDDEEFEAWYRQARGLFYNRPFEFSEIHRDDQELFIVRYLEEYSDDAAEIWATAPQDLNDYEVMTADFVGAEILDD